MNYAPCMRALAFATIAAATSAGAQSLADLRSDATHPGNVTTYGMGWAQQRYSPLRQITPANAKRLVPVWNLSLNHSANASTQPLIIDGTMYISLHDATVAVDAMTGRQKWRVPVKLPADINAYLCCGIQSRGMAVMDGILYRTTIDAQVVAMNIHDGKTVWTQQAADYKKGYSMTHAPLIAGGMLITGISGGEYGWRCASKSLLAPQHRFVALPAGGSRTVPALQAPLRRTSEKAFHSSQSSQA